MIYENKFEIFLDFFENILINNSKKKREYTIRLYCMRKHLFKFEFLNGILFLK